MSAPKLGPRQQLVVDHLPWVHRYQKPRPCTAVRYGHGRRPCKNRAYWKFTALKRSWVRDGVYCWSHLISHGIYGDMVEDARTVSRLYARGVYCPSVSPKSGARCARYATGHDDHHTPGYRRLLSDGTWSAWTWDEEWTEPTAATAPEYLLRVPDEPDLEEVPT